MIAYVITLILYGGLLLLYYGSFPSNKWIDNIKNNFINRCFKVVAFFTLPVIMLILVILTLLFFCVFMLLGFVEWLLSGQMKYSELLTNKTEDIFYWLHPE